MSFLTGTPGSFKQLSNLTQQQQPLQNDLMNAGKGSFSQAADYYKGLLSNDNQDFDAMAAPELRRFNQQIIPDIAEQFAGAGSGALSSSGFQNSAVNAGVDLSERLGAIRAQLRQSAAQGLSGIGNMGLNPTVENVYQPARPGLVDTAAQGIGAATGIGGGSWLASKFR